MLDEVCMTQTENRGMFSGGIEKDRDMKWVKGFV